MRLHFDYYIDNLLKFKKLNCNELINLTDQSCIMSLCELLECCTFNDLAENIPIGLNESQYKYLIKIWFIFWYELIKYKIIFLITFHFFVL